MAIDFPSTTGQATDGSFAHTASGITWTWDGTTWKAQGITSNYVLPTAAANTLGGVKVGSGLSISGTGILSATPSSSVNNIDDLGDVTITSASTGQVIKYDGASWVNQADDTGTTINALNDIGDVSAASPSNNDIISWNGSAWEAKQPTAASGLQSRVTRSVSANGLAANASSNVTITAARCYALLKIQTSHAAWVTLYTDSSSRTNDAARSEQTDPLPGTGVIAEVITTGDDIQKITPGTIGWNNDNTPSNDCYVKVVNKSGSTNDIQVTLHYVQLEA